MIRTMQDSLIWTSLRLAFVCGLLVVELPKVVAAPLQARPPATTAPAGRPTRPQMPARFDRETVQRLLADIDKPHSASILKVGYFMRRGQPELPTGEGFALLKAAADAEPVGTKKWFLLQNLRAFSAFRVGEADTAEGFTAYNALFARAADAAKSNAEYPLRQAITEFVAAVPGKFRDLGLSKDESTRQTLFKAWAAYAVALSAPKTAMKGRTIEPAWSAAIEESGASEAFVPYVEKVLADVSVPKTFGLLLAAASVIAVKNPDKALSLLQQAKPLLPQENGKPDVNQAARFYNTLVELLVSRDRLPDAISTQQEFVKLTGRGQAKLMLLGRKSGNQAEVERLLAALNEPSANEQEIKQASSGLLTLAHDAKTPDAKAGEQAATLLKTYLSVQRTRGIEEELNARLALGGFYLRQRKLDDAKTALTFALPREPISSRVRSLLRSVERMNTQIEKTAQIAVESTTQLSKENTP